MNVFARTGLFLNGATPFLEIRRACPEPLILPPRSMSRRAAIEAYIALFRQAVARCAVADSIVALSGGCDSRHILLELAAQRRLPKLAVTMAIPDRPTEVSIASELAARVGIPHSVLEPSPSATASDEAWKNWRTDFMTTEHGWMAGLGRIRMRDTVPWWDGIGGDVLSAGLFLEEANLACFRQGRLDQLADSLVLDGPVALARDQALFPRQAAVIAVHAELKRHAAAPNPVGSFYFWNRTRVAVAAAAFQLLRGDGPESVLTPYLDWDLWEHLASLPAEMYVDHRFHVDTVATAYPGFASLPYFDAGEKRKPGYRQQWRGFLSLLDYSARHTLTAPGSTAEVLMRGLLNVFQPRRLQDSGWLIPQIVYRTELLRLAGW